ncbi:MAG: hypothetical protein NTV34_15360 [Proteobacteria bacterium]|nr:hypothetical protein [Pseudomonadota bacterium]
MMIEHEDEETTKNPPPLNLETDLCAGGQVFELQSEDGLSLEFFAELQAEELSREAERAEVVDLTLELALEGAADEEVSEESVEDEVKDGTLGISEELTLMTWLWIRAIP